MILTFYFYLFCYHSKMHLTVLGSGTSVPHAERSSSGFWLETRGGSLMLDFSPSAIHRMAQEKLDWANLDAVWISHFHLDHFGGLVPFLFGTKYASDTQERTKPLRVFGAGGLKKLISAFDEANNYRILEQPFPVEIYEIKTLEKFEILAGVKAVPVSTPHTVESHAIRVIEGEKSLVFTADTGFSRDLAALAGRCDLFILECSFIQNKPAEKHLELAEAIHLIRKAKPKRAMLTHLYPEWDDVDFQQVVNELSPLCEVLEAKDGLRIKI